MYLKTYMDIFTNNFKMVTTSFQKYVQILFGLIRHTEGTKTANLFYTYIVIAPQNYNQ